MRKLVRLLPAALILLASCATTRQAPPKPNTSVVLPPSPEEQRRRADSLARLEKQRQEAEAKRKADSIASAEKKRAEELATVPRIAVFAPLYLDSAFTASGEDISGGIFPRVSLNGLEFMNGVWFALDSLRREGREMDVFLYDTRDPRNKAEEILNADSLLSLDLVIGAVSGTEYLQLAEATRKKQVPFVSATYPNDGGVKENPYLIIMNSTLQTHVQAIYRYIQRTHPLDNIIVVHRGQAMDTRVLGMLKSFQSSGAPLRWKEVLVNNNPDAAQLQAQLNSEKPNVILASSLDEAFGVRLATALAPLATTYDLHLMGMPSWDGYRDFQRSVLNDLPIYYSTTYYNPQTDEWSKRYAQQYFNVNYSRPSDIAFKGYETMFYFSRLLLNNKAGWQLYQQQPAGNGRYLNDPRYRLVTDFDFRAVAPPATPVPNYYENQRIYILRRVQGAYTRVQ